MKVTVGVSNATLGRVVSSLRITLKTTWRDTLSGWKNLHAKTAAIPMMSRGKKRLLETLMSQNADASRGTLGALGARTAMFKKCVPSGSHTQLSKSDAKKLRKAAAETMGVDETLLESSGLMPPKSDVVVGKLNNAKVYCVNEQLLFFDPNGKGGRILPTVYTMWAIPEAMPRGVVTHSEVSPKVLGGADLMLPGFITSDEGFDDGETSEWAETSFAAGDVLALRARGNPHAFAIGEMAVSKAEAEACGMKGRGMKVMHHYPDALWALGDKSTPGDSFRPERVFRVRVASLVPDGAAREARDATSGDALESHLEKVRLSNDDDRSAEAAPPSAGAAALDRREDEKDIAETDAPPSAGLPPIDVSTPGGMDAMFERCFITALMRGLKDGDLPMRSELFYANLLLPSRPPDVTLDLKKSTFKKQQKLFASFEKRKLIAVKKVHGHDAIVRVDRDHPAYLEFARASGDAGVGAGTSSSAKPGAADAAAAAGSGDEENGALATLAKKSDTARASAVVVVTPKYRASTAYRPIFGARAVGNKDRLYDERECAEALREYCEANHLFVDEDAEDATERASAGAMTDAIGTSRPDASRVVRLDALLGKELFGKKEAEGPGSRLAERLVVPRLLKKLQKHVVVSVTRGSELSTVVLKRALRPIKVRVDRRGGRKHVTSVSGLEDFAVDPEAFASAAQKSFSAATSVARLPGNAETGVEISIQGNVLRELVHALRADWGIPGKYIETQDKSK